jgi:hypothetical protein
VNSDFLVLCFELLLMEAFPAEVLAVDVRESVENAIATKDDEVMEVFVKSEV